MAAATDRLLFANNRTAHLAIALGVGDGSLTLAAGEGAGWPEPTGGQYFVLTIQDLLTGALEICHGTGRLGDTITLVRGQEGTTAKDFTVDMSIVQMRVTKGVLDKLLQQQFTSADAGKYLQVQPDGSVIPVIVDIPDAPDTPVMSGFTGASVKRTTDLVIAADVPVSLAFDTQLYDTSDIWSNSPGQNPTRFYAPVDGFYGMLITAFWSDDPASVGRRCIFIHKNGVASAESGLIGSSEAKGQFQQVMAHAYLNAGEFFDAWILATNATTMKCSVQNATATFFSTVGVKGDEGDVGPPGSTTEFMRGATFVSSAELTTAIPAVSVYFNKPSRIKRIVMLGDTTGAAVVDIKKQPLSSYTGGVSGGTSICGADKPTITSGAKLDKDTFTDWVIDVSPGDVLNFSLASVATFKRLTVQAFFIETSA